MSEQTSIKCPNCGTSIDVNDILKHQLEESIRIEFHEKATSQANELASKNEALEKAKAIFEAKKKLDNEMFADRLEKETKAAEKEITAKLKAKLEKRGMTVLTPEVNELIKGGGFIRCVSLTLE